MLSTQLSAEDQAMLDQMREDDKNDAGSPSVETPSEPTSGAAQSGEHPEGDADKPERRERQDFVPLATHLEEKNERRRLEREVASEREARARLDERTNLILQRMQQQEQQRYAAPELQIPPLEQDPVGHITAQQEVLRRQMNSAIAAGAYQNQQAQNANAVIAQHLQVDAIQKAVVQRAQALENQYKADHSDYDDALQYLKSARGAELTALGQNDAQVAQQLQQEGFSLAVHAIQTDQNPADLIYRLAKVRGYARGEESADAKPSPGSQKLQNLAAGQRQSRSLSNARGGGPVPMTAQRLLEMSESEFAKMMDTPEGLALLGKGG